MWSFLHSTRDVTVGAGCLSRAAEIAHRRGCRRPALVVDPWFATQEVTRQLIASLHDACGTDPLLHALPDGEPDLVMVEGVRAALEPFSPDLILALGGGSAMDAAKVARMLLSNPGAPQAIAGPVGVVMQPHASLFIAAPTTAGTGSEVSESAVIAATGESYKMIFRSAEMTPQVALLDATLCTSAPPGVTAASGMDAVTHAVEAFWARTANPITDMLARQAMRLLAASLPRAFDQPHDLSAREDCLVGSMLAAMAFNAANLGLAHAISGALGALHHVPHGLANALALPHVAAFNAQSTSEKAADVAQIFGGAGPGEALSALRDRLGLRISLDTLVAPDMLDAVATASMRSGQLRVNPRTPTEAEVRGLLEAMR